MVGRRHDGVKASSISDDSADGLRGCNSREFAREGLEAVGRSRSHHPRALRRRPPA